MGQVLDRILAASTAHHLETTADGLFVVRRSGRVLAFDRLANRIMDQAGDEYVAFPIADQAVTTRFERIYIVPMD